MPPTVQKISPWVDPPGYRRVNQVSEMYQLDLSAPSVSFHYNVGIPLSSSVLVYGLFRNTTFNADLDLKISLPSYLTCSIGVGVTVNSKAAASFEISAVEDEVKKLTFMSKRDYLDQISVEVMPVLISGPVYVLSGPDVSVIDFGILPIPPGMFPNS